MKEGDPCHVTEWLDESTKKVAAGQHVLAYIEHVMEGQLPTDMENDTGLVFARSSAYTRCSGCCQWVRTGLKYSTD